MSNNLDNINSNLHPERRSGEKFYSNIKRQNIDGIDKSFYRIGCLAYDCLGRQLYDHKPVFRRKYSKTNNRKKC